MPSSLKAKVTIHRDRARDSVRYALLRTAQDVLAGLTAGGDGAPADVTKAALDGAAQNTQRTDAVVDGAATTSWGDGRWDGLTSDKEKRIYLRYHIQGEPTGDGKNRPTHKAMVGKVYPAEHPIWKVWRPPNGYGCRCWVTAHSYEEVLAAGWEITEDFPEIDGKPAVPDAGWQKHHGADDYDWAAFPASWKTALQVKEPRA